MIWNAKDVKAACNRILSAAFSDKLPVYGNDTLDGYARPSFFSELIATPRDKPGMFLTRHRFAYKVTYFEETHDEAHCYDVYNTIVSAFEPTIKVNGKRLVVESTDLAWIDENADMMQITINFSGVAELGGNSASEPLMLDVETKIESEVN